MTERPAENVAPKPDPGRQINRWMWDRLPAACRKELRRQYRRDRQGSWVGNKPNPHFVKSRLEARAHSEALRNGMDFALAHCAHSGSPEP